jgi:hypothetical protein
MFSNAMTMRNSAMSSLLWDLMETEAPDKFFVGDAERPGFLLFPRYHFLAHENRWTLYLNSVGLIDTFSTMEEALERLRQIVATARASVKVFTVSKTGRNRSKPIVFAEKLVTNVTNASQLLQAG